MSTSLRLKALLLPLVAAGAAVLLTGCIQIGTPRATAEPTSDSDTSEESDAPSDDGDTVDVFSLSVGDCILDPGSSDAVTETTVVDCAEEHNYEVYAESTVEDGDYPGDEAIGTQADAACADAFEPFVGVSYDDSQYVVNYFVPTEGSWGQGDRAISCLIADPSGSNTGTLEGANQ